jgi:tRNA-splicing ligase RtcB (3'-phosphate/5'-hydroxy nucleic acid ligase)
MESNYEVIDAGNGKIIKAWRKGVKFEDKAIEQLKNTASLPFIFKYIAAMPDTHWGMGSTVGTVLPTIGAVVPAAVGVDIGCGMLAIKTDVTKECFMDGDIKEVRKTIEEAVPAGRTNDGGKGDRGAWFNIPQYVQTAWNDQFDKDYEKLCEKHPGARAHNTVNQLGTLGTGNHFIELCEDEEKNAWIVLHSGSRGLGNKIGSYFTQVAKKLCEGVSLPDKDLSYLLEKSEEFADYKGAVTLAQAFAWKNRMLMAGSIIAALHNQLGIKFNNVETVHCHHNYISWENHFDTNVIVTRKGAVKAALGDMGIIPGSMGARTYIVRGLGNPDSFNTCSHGAGRAMSRTQAVKTFSIADHEKATEGVECLKDFSVLDETPGAYKDIEAVMAAQSDLVEPVYRLKQFVCVKGASDNKRGKRRK